jgi:O-antigen/teichoic acid export membrane protein
MARYSYAAVLANAGPVLVGNVMSFVLTQVHLWVVASRMPAHDVAVYASAARMVNLVSMTLIIANQVLPPIIGELAARGDKALLERTLRGTALVVGVPTLMVLGPFVFAGKLVMRLAFGPFYESGAEVLAILSVGQVANVFTGSSAFTLLMTGHSVAVMWLSGLAGGAMTVVCLLVAGGGVEHVAWAVSAVLVVQQLVTLVVAKRLVGVWTHPSFSAAAGMANRAWAARKSLLSQ